MEQRKFEESQELWKGPWHFIKTKQNFKKSPPKSPPSADVYLLLLWSVFSQCLVFGQGSSQALSWWPLKNIYYIHRAESSAVFTEVQLELMGEFELKASSILLNQMGQGLCFSLEAKWYHTAHTCSPLLPVPRRDGLSLAEGFLGWLGGMNRGRCQRHVQTWFCCCREGIQDSMQGHFFVWCISSLIPGPPSLEVKAKEQMYSEWCTVWNPFLLLIESVN